MIALLSFSLWNVPAATAEEGGPANASAVAADATSRAAPADIGTPDAVPVDPPAPVDPPPADPPPVDPPPAEPPPVDPPAPVDPPVDPPAPVDPPPADPPPVDPPAPVDPPPAGPPPVDAPPVDAPPADAPPAGAAAPASTSAPAAAAVEAQVDAQVEKADALASAPGRPVVVCKYVRKPNAAELLHHVIIVNSNGLLGIGFSGSFPFAFSDAHFNSLAIRYAAPGEQAKDVPLSACPTREEPPPPPPPPPPGGENPDNPVTDTPDGVLDPGSDGGTGALGDTGASTQLAPLLGLALASLVTGLWLVLRGRRGLRLVG